MKWPIAILLTLVLLGCSATPNVTLSAHRDNSDLVFDIKTTGINGLLWIAIWQVEPKEYFWIVNLNYYNKPELRYGDIPTNFTTFNGAHNKASQKFPFSGTRPRPLNANKEYHIEITYQYDQGVDAFSGQSGFLVSTDAAGSIISIVPHRGAAPPRLAS